MIKLLVMDVDGTLTDGMIYMGADGELQKAFNIKDGCGIKVLLPQNNIVPVVITARNSDMVYHRCSELGIAEIHQGVRDKMQCLSSLLDKYSCQLGDVAYMGDDIIDLQCMMPIKEHGGLIGCPADAVNAVVSQSDFVSSCNAGQGAVRQFIEYIIERNRSCIGNNVRQRLDVAVGIITQLDYDKLEIGRHDVSESFFFNVLEYDAPIDDSIPFESHRKHIDIQRVISGTELLRIADVSRLVTSTAYDPINDVQLYKDFPSVSGVILSAGSIVVLQPSDAHKAVSVGNTSNRIKKVVGKLLI